MYLLTAHPLHFTIFTREKAKISKIVWCQLTILKTSQEDVPFLTQDSELCNRNYASQQPILFPVKLPPSNILLKWECKGDSAIEFKASK